MVSDKWQDIKISPRRTAASPVGVCACVGPSVCMWEIRLQWRSREGIRDLHHQSMRICSVICCENSWRSSAGTGSSASCRTDLGPSVAFLCHTLPVSGRFCAQINTNGWDESLWWRRFPSPGVCSLTQIAPMNFLTKWSKRDYFVLPLVQTPTCCGGWFPADYMLLYFDCINL